jgi:hypothetical protein
MIQAQIIEQVQPAIAHVEWAIRACLVCIDLGQSRNVARQSLTRFKRLQCLNVRSRTGNREYDHLRFVLLDRAGGMVNNSWLRLNDCCYLGKFGRLWSLVLTLELRTLVVNTEANPLKKKTFHLPHSELLNENEWSDLQQLPILSLTILPLLIDPDFAKYESLKPSQRKSKQSMPSPFLEALRIHQTPHMNESKKERAEDGRRPRQEDRGSL